MNGILGMTDLALTTNLTHEQQEYMKAVKVSGEALLTLINDILDFSRIEAGRLTIDPVECDVHRSTAETVKFLALRAHEKNLEISLEITPDVPARAIVDFTRVRQVLINLIGNAIKFTAKGEVAVRVERLPSADGSCMLKVSVRDTGIGIESGKLKAVFDAFTQADSSITRQYGGTGLGLAISLQLVRLMGGSFTVESKLEQGSCFAFTLPCELPEEAGSNPALPTLETRMWGSDPLGRALVVDQNCTNRRILAGLLARLRWKCVEVATWEDAAAQIDAANGCGDPFALILADGALVTPAALASAMQSHSVKVVVLLRSTEVGNQTKAFGEYGFTQYLIKPILEADLYSVLFGFGYPDADTAVQPAAIDSATATRENVDDPLDLLVAEDNPVNQLLARRLLEKEGHLVTVVEDGAQAVAAAGRHRFDLILMDIQMPHMGGFEATARIRELEQQNGLPRTPIIALTAHAMKGDEGRCRDADLDDYLSKPLRVPALKAKLELWNPRAKSSVI